MKVSRDSCLEIETLFSPILFKILAKTEAPNKKRTAKPSKSVMADENTDLEITEQTTGSPMKVLRSYALNILVKIARNHTRSLSDYRGAWFSQILTMILNCPEGPDTDKEAQSQTLAVKYFAFNQVLDSIQPEAEESKNQPHESVWPKYALQWIQIGAEVLSLGPQIRDRKSQAYEGWLQEQSDLQFKLLTTNENLFTKLAIEFPFYMLYTLPTIQARIVALPGVRVSIQKEVLEKPRAATTYMVADWEWISLNKDDINPLLKEILLTEAKTTLADRDWVKDYPKESKVLKSIIASLSQKPVLHGRNKTTDKHFELDEEANNSMSVMTFQKFAGRKKN